jgi:hypothetical protein
MPSNPVLAPGDVSPTCLNAVSDSGCVKRSPPGCVALNALLSQHAFDRPQVHLSMSCSIFRPKVSLEQRPSVEAPQHHTCHRKRYLLLTKRRSFLDVD